MGTAVNVERREMFVSESSRRNSTQATRTICINNPRTQPAVTTLGTPKEWFELRPGCGNLISKDEQPAPAPDLAGEGYTAALGGSTAW